MDVRYGFLSADTISDNYLTLVVDTDKTTDNRNQHFYASVFTPECKNSSNVLSKEGLFDIPAVMWFVWHYERVCSSSVVLLAACETTVQLQKKQKYLQQKQVFVLSSIIPLSVLHYGADHWSIWYLYCTSLMVIYACSKCLHNQKSDTKY